MQETGSTLFYQERSSRRRGERLRPRRDQALDPFLQGRRAVRSADAPRLDARASEKGESAGLRGALQTARLLVVCAAIGALTAALWSERKCAEGDGGVAATICRAMGADARFSRLSFEDIHVRRKLAGATSYLLVDGSVLSQTKAPPAVGILVNLTSASNYSLYAWPIEAPASRAGHDGRYAFTARLEAPPIGASKATLSFLEHGRIRPGAENE